MLSKYEHKIWLNNKNYLKNFRINNTTEILFWSLSLFNLKLKIWKYFNFLLKYLNNLDKVLYLSIFLGCLTSKKKNINYINYLKNIWINEKNIYIKLKKKLSWEWICNEKTKMKKSNYIKLWIYNNIYKDDIGFNTLDFNNNLIINFDKLVNVQGFNLKYFKLNSNFSNNRIFLNNLEKEKIIDYYNKNYLWILKGNILSKKYKKYLKFLELQRKLLLIWKKILNIKIFYLIYGKYINKNIYKLTKTAKIFFIKKVSNVYVIVTDLDDKPIKILSAGKSRLLLHNKNPKLWTKKFRKREKFLLDNFKMMSDVILDYLIKNNIKNCKFIIKTNEIWRLVRIFLRKIRQVRLKKKKIKILEIIYLRKKSHNKGMRKPKLRRL